jgi:hypothetical protein
VKTLYRRGLFQGVDICKPPYLPCNKKCCGADSQRN